ncbi:hypothetical protein AK812_SmicGene24508 [Symbiodinium microadriaticum]|uniref:Uncharacterized protein n=1 Tax=Symbiodinium microadriaticum TaxID=2951 RepID=A0A1Q9DEG5_SYMMI|nr:hypothetical protein AK812_SmicGene24508 [Symbiodinium microadriaticum]
MQGVGESGYHRLAQAKALSLPHQARHRAASLAKYITEKHRTPSEDSSDGTSTSGNEDGTSSNTDETDKEDSDSSKPDNDDEDDEHVNVDDRMIVAAMKLVDEDDQNEAGAGEVPEHEEHKCHEEKCSMQVHELNDFLNHTSLRNLSGDDMTAICLGPDMPEPDMCDEKKLEGCMPFIQDAIELLNGTNLTGLDSDRSRHLCESMHDFDLNMVCEPVDYPPSAVCREDPRHPEPPHHEEKCDREQLKDCDRYITELSHMVNMSNSTTISGFTMDEMKDMCYARTLVSLFRCLGTQ